MPYTRTCSNYDVFNSLHLLPVPTVLVVLSLMCTYPMTGGRGIFHTYVCIHPTTLFSWTANKRALLSDAHPRTECGFQSITHPLREVLHFRHLNLPVGGLRAPLLESCLVLVRYLAFCVLRGLHHQQHHSKSSPLYKGTASTSNLFRCSWRSKESILVSE